MDLNLPDGKYAAYLFDFDGTIVNSMPVHYQAWIKALAEWNCEFSEDLFYDWAGIPVAQIVERLNALHSISLPVQDVILRKEEIYLGLLPGIQTVPEVLHHIRLQQGQIPFAIVTGSARDSVLKTLAILGLTESFPVIVGHEDYTHGKPHPEPFLTAAKRLGVDPADCLVFEDGDFGIQAAEAAGMSWVRVPSRRGLETALREGVTIA
jgi:beta-phosphoglucomutase-like phosphatase (HAD superfamily)